MTHGMLTALLAESILGWTVTPTRFLTGKGSWKPRWKFQPTEKLADAFRLLECAAPTKYSVGRNVAGRFWARVEINAVTGEAVAKSKAAAITLAVARAVGIVIEGGKL